MMDFIAYSGLIACIWIVTGIYIASLFYPGYRHSIQFCSELGASGSPTQKLSPAINNYPLGALFVLFGCFVIFKFGAHVPTLWIGVMTIVHGLCTWVCGYFPMDADPYTPTPTTASLVHTWSGLVMFLCFLIAPVLVSFSDYYPAMLRLISALSIMGCLYFSWHLATALKKKSRPGLYQRLSYGCQILWLFIYSLYLVV